MSALYSIHWFLIAACWYAINGFLHDIFILKAHSGPYNRDLLRLLMDGHVLILSGILLAICWYMIRINIVHAAAIAFVTGLFMVIYCAMIFPFLKSFVTLFISIILCIASLHAWITIKT
jgi:hypothetical protein